jgi:Flp pilus assembly protein TadD
MAFKSGSMRVLTFAGVILIAAGFAALYLFRTFVTRHGSSASQNLASAFGKSESGPRYVDPAVCATCHAAIADTYKKTGMGRSFYVPKKSNEIERYSTGNIFKHPASGMQYEMEERSGSFFQRRTMIGAEGASQEALEERVDYIIGSGNQARTYLHRTPAGRLIELPVSWYTEKGGYWAMSPNFDWKNQTDMHGAVGAECMFCHDGYPATDGESLRNATEIGVFPAQLPMGIDCQRCHGPGSAHVAAAMDRNFNEQAVRSSIVNPARLPRDRQLEVCFECHLETSARHIPAAIRNYDRDVFSFRPGQLLGDYKVYFERPTKPAADDFEVGHAGYQLRKSACFRNSQMTCLTCHDPHDVPHGPGAIAGYVKVCAQCHSEVRHNAALPKTENCITCHMPKRRSGGAVHIILTDHSIPRLRPAGDLLAPLEERAPLTDHTPVQIYYPEHPPQDGRTELYTSIAQVDDGDGVRGLAHLQETLEHMTPPEPEPYLEMARALVRRNRQAEAIPWFDRALERRPQMLAAMREKGVTLASLGRTDEAAVILEKAANLYPKDDVLLTDLGDVFMQQNELDKAEDALQKAIAVNPERGEALNFLGLIAIRRGDEAGAEANFREAIRMRPDLPAPHDSLGWLLTGRRNLDEASREFRLALFYDDKDGEAHHGLGLLAILKHDPNTALLELKTAAELEPANAQTHNALADVLSAKGEFTAAAAEYRRAIELNPSQWDGHLGLAMSLIRMNEPASAVAELQIAASAPDANVRAAAQNLLRQLGR